MRRISGSRFAFGGRTARAELGVGAEMGPVRLAMQTDMTRRKFVGLAAMGAAFSAAPARADAPSTFTIDEVVDDGHRFFGSVSRGLAEGIQEACRRWGLPNAYVLGQEASGAFIGGLRYGEGKMYTRNAGNQPIYWQGPSLGFDYGADGDRTMMLVYNLPAVDSIFRRFGGIDGSAYFIGGLGFTALDAEGIVVVPIRTGLGVRLGINVNYLKFTQQATWNPF